jgi:hypothetical protein
MADGFATTSFGAVEAGRLFWSRSGDCYAKIEPQRGSSSCGRCMTAAALVYNACHASEPARRVHFCPDDAVRVRVGDG